LTVTDESAEKLELYTVPEPEVGTEPFVVYRIVASGVRQVMDITFLEAYRSAAVVISGLAALNKYTAVATGESSLPL